MGAVRNGSPKRWSSFIRTVGVFALALPLIAAAAESSPPQLLGVQYSADLSTLVADERGYFRDAAANLRVNYTSSGRQNLQQLRAGEADFAVMKITPVVIDALQDSSPGERDDPVILGTLVDSPGSDQLVSLSDTGITKPADLEGRRVGLTEGTSAEFFWWLFARKHGLEPDTVTRVELPIEQLPAALTGGRVDAAVLWEPWASRVAQATEAELRPLPGASACVGHWVVVARRAFVAAHPALTRDLLQGYIRSIDWIDNHRKQALELNARRMEIPQSRLERGGLVFDYHLDLDWTVLNALQLQLDWASNSGYGDAKGTPLGVLRLVEPEPLRRLDAFRVSIPGPAADERGRQP